MDAAGTEPQLSSTGGTKRRSAEDSSIMSSASASSSSSATTSSVASARSSSSGLSTKRSRFSNAKGKEEVTTDADFLLASHQLWARPPLPRDFSPATSPLCKAFEVCVCVYVCFLWVAFTLGSVLALLQGVCLSDLRHFSFFFSVLF
jgi:hypothetical protein